MPFLPDSFDPAAPLADPSQPQTLKATTGHGHHEFILLEYAIKRRTDAMDREKGGLLYKSMLISLSFLTGATTVAWIITAVCAAHGLDVLDLGSTPRVTITMERVHASLPLLHFLTLSWTDQDNYQADSASDSHVTPNPSVLKHVRKNTVLTGGWTGIVLVKDEQRGGRSAVYVAHIAIPFLYLFVLFAAYPALVLWRGLVGRRRRRERIGLCQSCGYDPRGLTEPRCPECGMPFNN